MIRILLVLVGLLIFQSEAFAARKTYAMGMPVFRAIEEANVLMEENKSDDAIEVLTKRLEKRNSPYERAQMHYLLASYYYRLEKMDTAISHFTTVLEGAGKMPEMLHQQSLKTLMQLHMIREEFEQAKSYGIELIEITEEPIPHDFALLSQVHYKLSDWQSALDTANQAMEIYALQQKVPDENLLLIINASHFELGQLDKMIEVLNLLVKHYPKETYILYLASIYGQMEQHEQQLSLMEALYDGGKMDDEPQLKSLASLYMSLKVPYKSAELLAKAIDDGQVKATSRNYQFLSQAWQLAAEAPRAIDALSLAAEMEETGDLYLRKAYLLFDIGEWPQVIKSAHLALDKGLEEEQEGETWLLLGMTLLQTKEYDKALRACRKAADYDESRKLAKQWISYIRTEQDKYLAYLDVGD